MIVSSNIIVPTPSRWLQGWGWSGMPTKDQISEVPRLLRAEDLYYLKDGKKTKVPIYEKTGLPHGLIEGTNAENFFIRAGGWNCGHAIRPVPERNVPLEVRDRVYNTAAYQRWKSNNG